MACPHCDKDVWKEPDGERHPEESAILKGGQGRSEESIRRDAWTGTWIVFAIIGLLFFAGCCNTICKGKITPDQNGAILK